ncbi:MAG: ribbon-helix-helix protein, CopG family [Actinomycetota bacterium]
MKKVKGKYTLGPDIDLDSEVVLDRDGIRITERRARKLAEEVISQKVGRPSLTGVGKQSPEIKARVPLKLKKSLQREAKRRGLTSSELVRQAIEEFLRSA